jgi:hypothetical protein
MLKLERFFGDMCAYPLSSWQYNRPASNSTQTIIILKQVGVDQSSLHRIKNFIGTFRFAGSAPQQAMSTHIQAIRDPVSVIDIVYFGSPDRQGVFKIRIANFLTEVPGIFRFPIFIKVPDKPHAFPFCQIRTTPDLYSDCISPVASCCCSGHIIITVRACQYKRVPHLSLRAWNALVWEATFWRFSSTVSTRYCAFTICGNKKPDIYGE